MKGAFLTHRVLWGCHSYDTEMTDKDKGCVSNVQGHPNETSHATNQSSHATNQTGDAMYPCIFVIVNNLLHFVGNRFLRSKHVSLLLGSL